MTVQGRVQGVGYRYYAERKASALGLTGYAINQRDGSVKLHVEGARELIETFVKDLENGPPLASVTSCSLTWLPATGKYHSFSIRLAEFD